MNDVVRFIQKTKQYFTYILTNSIAGSYFCPIQIRRIIYNFFGHKVKGTIYPEAFIGFGPEKLTIEKNSYCNYRCFFDLGADIIIGNNCSIAYGVTFVNSSHHIGNADKRGGEIVQKQIIIKDGCWIGANATIMPGVTIEEGCIIGTGSLVNTNCKRNGIYVGVPAKRIRDL